MVEYSLFRVCQDHTAETHVFQFPDCFVALGSVLASTELLVESLLQNPVEDRIPVNIKKPTPSGFGQEGHERKGGDEEVSLRRDCSD